jgi:hypothetical protein
MFPVQLIEAAWVAATVAVGSAMVTAGAPPGDALAWYSVVYGVGRFSLEFVRGDRRPYWGLFSEAQWTTLLLLLATAAGEFAGILPFHAWHLALTGALVLAMTVLMLRGGAALRLLRGPHTHEVAELLAEIGDAAEGKVELGTTSLGLRLSASRHASGAGDVRLLAFSYAPRPLRDGEALRLGRLLRRLLGESGEVGGLLRGSHGVFHLITPARGSAHAL